MPRPVKRRKVCRLPETPGFDPAGGRGQKPALVLSVDEYETLRLIDGEGLSQEACGARMEVARTTVQQIYKSARKKLADALVGGLPLRIVGGGYRLCDGVPSRHGCGRCPWRENVRKITEDSKKEKNSGRSETMKIAIPIDETEKNVCTVFARAPYFGFYDTETKQTELFVNPAAQAQGGAGVKAAQFVADNGASALLTPRCGENAGAVFKAAGIKVYEAGLGGVQENLALFEEGRLPLLTSFHAGFQGAPGGGGMGAGGGRGYGRGGGRGRR